MLTQRSLNYIFSQIKIHFCIQKQVQFGKALYVSGNLPEIGNWKIQNSIRLQWNEEHYWSGTVIIPAYIYQNMNFKYIIASWNHPQLYNQIWQDGTNRKIDIQNDQRCIICNHKWNKQKITLNICVEKTNSIEEYFVVGNISELGRWKINNKMKKNPSNSRQKLNKQNSSESISQKNILDNKNVCSFTFYAYKGRQSFQYLFVKKGVKIEAQRYPGRIFLFEKNNSSFNRISTFYKNGNIQIYDNSSFHDLRMSNITTNISVGSYLMNSNDIETLKEKGITDILSIQTEDDYASHNLSIDYIQKISEKQGINYHLSDIKDKNSIDFIKNCLPAFQKMSKILKNNGKIYVHCSAGMYRSPQVIALYLILVEQYSIESAIQIIKERHPFARPSYSVISSAVNQILHKYQKKTKKVSF